MKTKSQVIDEINEMYDGSIMEIYKVQGGFKTQFQSGWVPAPTPVLCPKCGGVMKLTGIAKLSLPPQNEYKCEKCKYIEYKIETTSRELHSNFGELIEEDKPLFVTEDGFEVFDSRANIIVVNKRFEKLYWMAYMWEFPHSFHYKVFKHESNADEYILINKLLFSYKDFIRWGNVPYERVIMQLAKERSEE